MIFADPPTATSRIFAQGFPPVARHAWGTPLPGDLPLAAWLDRLDLSGPAPEGMDFLAPKLLRQGQSQGVTGNRMAMLKGLVRYRMASNALRAGKLGDVVDAIAAAGLAVSVASGWSDVVAGDLALHEATLEHAQFAAAPFDSARIAQVLQGLGWREAAGVWSCPLTLEPHNKASIHLTVHPRLPVYARAPKGLAMADGPHLPLPDRILAAAASLADPAIRLSWKRQALDRIEGLLAVSERSDGSDALRLHARQLRQDGNLRHARALIERIGTTACDGPPVALMTRLAGAVRRAWARPPALLEKAREA